MQQKRKYKAKTVDAEDGAMRIIRHCAQIRPKESMLVVVDDSGDETVAQVLATVGQRLGVRTEILRVTADALAADRHLSPDDQLAEHMAAYDVLFGVTSVSLYHSAAARQAAFKGSRVLALTGCSVSSLSQGAIEADFAALEPRCHQLADVLSGGSKLRVTAPGGLNLTAAITGRQGVANTGRAVNRGERTGCLDVEAFVAPLEGSANGSIVVDASTSAFGLVDAPIRLGVKDGFVTSCEGGVAASKIAALIEQLGPEMRVVAEFGFGLNPHARVIGDHIQDEATDGTGHVALGSNTSFGGTNRAPLHLDLVYWHPTLHIDGAPVSSAGNAQP